MNTSGTGSLWRVALLEVWVIGSVALNAPLTPAPAAYAQGGCAANNVGGRVYRDYNENGTLDAREPGVGDLTVTAYDASGAVVASAATSVTGVYALDVPNGANVRVEFTGLPVGMFSGPAGADSSTTAAFVQSPDCDVDLGINRLGDYCQGNPNLATTCFVPGPAASHPNDPVVVDFAYTAGNTAEALVTGSGGHETSGLTPPHPIAIPAAQVGSVYGLAYQRSTRTVFAASFLKRNSDFGPNGIGAVYRIDVSTGAATTASPFYNFGGLAGSIARVLPVNPAFDQDTEAISLIGKIAFGDMDILEDPVNPALDALYLVNLNDRKLYRLPVLAGPTAGVPVGYPIPGTTAALPGAVQGCPAADVRPFGLGIRDGMVYVGMVCSAESTGLITDLRAYVYSFDPGSNKFSSAPALEYSLEHPRGCADGAPACAAAQDGEWQRWNDNLASTDVAVNPQPLLTDITFDNGDMILAYRDRFGDQNRRARAAGDIVRACLVGGAYQLENNGACGPLKSAGSGNNQGPGGGEFYNREDYSISHQELGLGAALQVPGFPNVAATMYDPVFSGAGTIFDGGVRWFDSATGSLTRSYRLFDGGSDNDDANFGKNNGLGDLIALCLAPPLEIGNRVWLDTNSNGIQDPGETPRAGVTVRLYDSTGNLVGTTKTDAQGHYYFNDANVPGRVQPLTAYEIRLDNPADYAPGGPLAGLSLTLADQSADLRDSDGVLVGGFPIISVTTGGAGDNDHTFDFGFSTTPSPTSTPTPTASLPASGIGPGWGEAWVTLILVTLAGLSPLVARQVLRWIRLRAQNQT
jgi:hypothetical protein